MGRVYELLVKAKGDTSQARRDMNKLKRATRDLKKEIGINFGAIAKVGAAALGVGLALSVREGVGELIDMQKASAQTDAVLKSMGGTTKLTKGHIENLSGSLLQMSGIDDQVIQGGANILATFSKIGNSPAMFDRATKAALDLSVAFKKDMKQSSIMVGKALQDPVKGITALGRAGISFTAGQKKTIEQLVKSGKTAAAQKLILGELEKQVKGSAAAYGKTLPGQLSRLKESFAGVAAIMVGRLVPALVVAMAWAQKLVKEFSWWAHSKKGKEVIQEIGNALSLMGNVAGRVLGQLFSATGKVAGALFKWRDVLIPIAAGIMSVVAAVKIYNIVMAAWKAATIAMTVVQGILNGVMMMNPVTLIALAVLGLVVALVVAYKRSETFRKIVQGAFKAVGRAVKATVDWMKRAWNATVRGMTKAWTATVNALRKAWTATTRWISSAWLATVGAVRSGINKIKSVFSAIVGFVKAHWKLILPIVLGPFIGLPVLLMTKGREAAKKLIEGLIGYLKDHLHLPTISLDMKSKHGVPYPDFDIKWNAAGGVMTRPVLFGGGEAGAEAIVPLDKYAITRRDIQNGSGLTIHGGLHIHASGAREGKAAADAFLKSLQNSRQRQRAYNPRSRVAIA